MAKDRAPGNRGKSGPAHGGSSSAGRGASAARSGASGGRGRTRPPTQVVAQGRRPWGLIAASIAVVLFAVAAIGYAVMQARQADAEAIDSPEEIEGIQTFDYESGQTHVSTPVDYQESPPVAGEHEPPPGWADCTGTVYDVDIRHENAVHSLEHGAVWITYDPEQVSETDIATLAELVDGESGRMMSPYEGLDSAVSVQSWNHQLKVDSAADPRIEQFVDFFTYNADYFPEPGASCENAAFVDDPRLEAEDGQAPADGSATPAPGSAESTEPTGSAEPSGSAQPSEPAEPTATAAQ